MRKYKNLQQSDRDEMKVDEIMTSLERLGDRVTEIEKDYIHLTGQLGKEIRKRHKL